MGVKSSYFALSHLPDEREQTKMELLSKYNINEMYQRYWDRIVSSLPC